MASATWLLWIAIEQECDLFDEAMHEEPRHRKPENEKLGIIGLGVWAGEALNANELNAVFYSPFSLGRRGQERRKGGKGAALVL